MAKHIKGFTKEEQQVMDNIIAAHDLFASLEPTHPNDISEWVKAIHDLQKILGMRILRREHSEIFPVK